MNRLAEISSSYLAQDSFMTGTPANDWIKLMTGSEGAGQFLECLRPEWLTSAVMFITCHVFPGCESSTLEPDRFELQYFGQIFIQNSTCNTIVLLHNSQINWASPTELVCFSIQQPRIWWFRCEVSSPPVSVFPKFCESSYYNRNWTTSAWQRNWTIKSTAIAQTLWSGHRSIHFHILRGTKEKCQLYTNRFL